MSTAVADHTPASPSRASSAQGSSRYALGFGGVLKSEFLKFRIMISSWVLMAVTVGVMGLMSLAGAALANSEYDYGKDQLATVDPAADTTDYMAGVKDSAMHYAHGAPALGISMALLVLGAMGVVIVASEFGTKSIISTLTAAPRRGMVYAAKAVVIGVFSAVTAVVSMVVGYLLVQLLLQQDLRYGMFEGWFWMNVLGVAIVMVFIGLMGMGFGALLRNNAGAIVILVVLMFILPIFMSFLGNLDWAKDLAKYLPSTLANNISSPYEPAADPRYVASGVWYAVECLVVFVAGWFSFVRRDPK